MSEAELTKFAKGSPKFKISARMTEDGEPVAFEIEKRPGNYHGVAGRLTESGEIRPRWTINEHSLRDALRTAMEALTTAEPRFETVQVVVARPTYTPSEPIETIAVAAWAELLGRPAPADDELKPLKKAFKAELAKERAHRAGEKAKRAAQIAAEKAALLAARAKAAPVVDVPSFIEAIRTRLLDKGRVDKATSMLKKDGFRLYCDVRSSHIEGVVKSQTSPDLVYACRLDAEGGFGCCTQNLNVCGGLRGQPCKHLLVLLIGLAKAGEIDPTAVDGWVEKSRAAKPVHDRDRMSDVFLRYKGAEAGEIDWRPTETVPEDFYAY